ncbi:MAG: hypothetical protein KC449_16555 [Anaerolineales bacterium]|nr:hypothetical protein [Anaerolineales bacterium]
MSQAGAPAALEGYRVQALYTLKRILVQGSEYRIFQPEGLEDLDVLDGEGHIVELIQVKKYNSLKLSDLAPLSPEQAGSFFGRVIRALSQDDKRSIKLVNFGEIGPEMRDAWGGNEREKRSITRKLVEAGFSQPQVDLIFTSVELLSVDEEQEEEEVYGLLREMLVGIDSQHAFELLHFWLFLCMEQRKGVTQAYVIDKIQHVGRFLAERRDHHDQWFTTIQPLEDRQITADGYERLRKEFFEGGFTRYEHILADLDFYREQKLAAIKAGFQSSNVVIVHAASGQGKTTLAYRYLHDRFPSNWRFAIQRIESIQHALHVANALNGHANAVQAPMAIFVDVNPRDTAWPELIKQLARHPYLQVLVAIREEDFRRANVSGAEFGFVDVDLEFDEPEARLIFERAKASLSQGKFLDFEDAWDTFGDGGPLLEFVYLLTQTTTLRQRLESQVNRIRDEIREKNLAPDELQFLRLTATATAYEARLNTRKLIGSLNLPDPDRTLQFYEKEYLMRVSSDGQYIEGLHAIRSGILVDLLTSVDVNPWLEAAVEALPLIIEEDLESFILHTLVDRPSPEHTSFIETVTKLSPSTWAGLAGVLRGLLWSDAREYIKANQSTIEAAREEFGPGWYFIVDLNFSGSEGPNIDRWWADEKLSNLFSKERIEKLEAIRATQTPKESVFQLSSGWLITLEKAPVAPMTLSDWTGVAETLYWAKRFGIQTVGEWITNDDLDSAVQVIALSTLAELSFALCLFDTERHQVWLIRNQEMIQSRLAGEYNVIYLQEDDELLTVHFLPIPGESDEGTKDPLHDATIERVQLVRQLFPNYEKYGSQGYGHKLGPLKFRYDSTHKTGIEKRSLVPDLVTRINGITTGIGRNQFRPENWDEYITKVLEVRGLIIICLEQLRPGLGKYLERRNPVNVGATYINKSDWKRCLDLVNEPPDLPKIATDRWGFVTESSSKLMLHIDQQKYIPSGIALRKYRKYLDVQREYFSSIRNFILQTVDVTATNFNLSKLPPTANREAMIEALEHKGIKTDQGHLSTYNLWEAKNVLEKYQQEFGQLFGHRIEAEMLDTLMRQESELLAQVWELWYFYANEPQQIIPRALHKVPRKLEFEKLKLDRLIQQALANFGVKDVTVELLQTGLKWEDSPALWIRLDVQDPTALYQAFELLVTALQAVLSPIKFQELAYYLIQANYQYTVIIPTVCDRMINENAWPLFTASTVLREAPLDEQNWVSYVPKPLPAETREQLGIELWDLSGIEEANQFSTAVSSLMLLAAQISEFDNLPDASEEGLEMFQDHLSERSEALSNALQACLDSGAFLLGEFNSLSQTQQERRPYLREAVSTLVAISESILPSELADEQQLRISEMIEYAQQLAEIFLAAEYVKLYWIADVITRTLP